MDAGNAHRRHHNADPGWMIAFARLTVAALVFAVLAFPVTCMDAHGAHSLYVPPGDPVSHVSHLTVDPHGILALIDGPVEHQHHQRHHPSSTQIPSEEATGDQTRLNALDLGLVASGLQIAISSASVDGDTLSEERVLYPDVWQTPGSAVPQIDPPPPRQIKLP